MNDNAYKLDLPEGYNVSPTFNVRDLTPYLEDGVGVEDGAYLMANPFQQGGDDVLHHGSTSPREEFELEGPMVQEESYKGLISRSNAKFINLVTYLDTRRHMKLKGPFESFSG